MFGTVYEARDGKLVRIVDRSGHAWATLDWDGARLTRLEVPGATVHGAIAADLLLGDTHVLDTSMPDATRMTAVEWSRPTELPTVAAPGQLSPGSGGAILNAIAVLAKRAGVPALRYAGPYPTAALWRSLARSFRTDATEDEFTSDVAGRAMRVARDPISIDFVPWPCERVLVPDLPAVPVGRRSPGTITRGFVELRDSLERAVIDGVSYEPGGSPARLTDRRCEIWFGDQVWAHVATLARDGSLIEGLYPLPVMTTDVLGKEFPPPLAGAIADLVAVAVPPLLAADARAFVATRPIEWADLGARAARATPDGLLVHAALWERIGPLGLGRVALALAEALAPVVTAAIVAELVAPGPPPLHPPTSRSSTTTRP